MTRQGAEELMEFDCVRCKKRIRWKYMCKTCSGVNPWLDLEDPIITICVKCCRCELGERRKE